MATFKISSRLLGGAIWGRLFEDSAPLFKARATAFFEQMDTLEALRDKADYNTGSISTSTQWALVALARAVGPAVAVEVGTFIGKSALAIAFGMGASRRQGEIHTCDMSNHVVLPSVTTSRVVQYPGTSSTEMFNDLVADGYAGRVQLLHLDGRLQKEDPALLVSLAAPDMVIALDDFEGVEKGVANLHMLHHAGVFKNHVLIPPCDPLLLQRFGFWDHSATALLIPAPMIRLTSQ